MNAYLPVNTEVVILRNGQHQWYTTEKRVEISDYKVAPCPLRDAIPVLTAEVQGFRIWFLENQLEVVLSAEQKDFVCRHKFVKVEYDIPAVVSLHPNRYRDRNGRSFVHPSQWMWGYGVRTSKSIWLMTQEKYQAIQSRLSGLTRAGCQWEPTWIDSENAARHLQKAVISLRSAWLAADQSYAERLDNAEEQWQESNQSVEAERKWRYARNAIEKELDKRRENITQSATLYGIPLEWVMTSDKTVEVMSGKLTVASSATISRSNKAEGKSSAEAHVEMVDALKAKGFVNEAELVDNGTMPYNVAKDFCEDNEVMCDENGEFSLKDLLK